MKSVILVNECYHETGTSRVIALEQLCGVSLLKRHVRTLQKCGLQAVTIIVPNDAEVARLVADETAPSRNFVEVVQQDGAEAQLNGDEAILVIAGNYFIEQRLITHLISLPGPSLLVDRGPDQNTRELIPRSPHAAVGCAVVNETVLKSLFQGDTNHWQDIVESLVDDTATAQYDVETIPTYDHTIRRHRRDRWIKVTMSSDLNIAHSWIIDGAQKGSLDLPAQMLHAPIENYIVSRLCTTSITPNQVTLTTNVAAWAVTWGILSGFIWLALVGAAFVGILDGLDGKLARVKLMTSKIGELEHLLDMLFEYSWWLSLGWVLGNSNVDSPAFMAAVGLVFLNFADSMTGVFFWFTLGQTHNRILDNYTPFELSVRKISGRRNTYVWLLLLAGPFIGLNATLWICVLWGVVTIVVRGGRALWFISVRQAPTDFAF